MTPRDVTQEAIAQGEERHRYGPQGVSVLVAAPQYAASLVAEVAPLLAKEQYTSSTLTGRVLYVGMNELGPGLHEVVLEVAD